MASNRLFVKLGDSPGVQPPQRDGYPNTQGAAIRADDLALVREKDIVAPI